jgi:hypothetical protein
MSMQTLESLAAVPYLNETGEISPAFEGKIGLYAIFDQSQTLQYVGFSRDISLSLRQHLVRTPESCYWVKTQTVTRPSRTLLAEMQQAWIAEHGAIPPGNGPERSRWEKPIDVRSHMTEAEKTAIAQADGLDEIKQLKQVARRVQAEILDTLKAREVQMELRFNPKLKEQGLLDLK